MSSRYETIEFHRRYIVFTAAVYLATMLSRGAAHFMDLSPIVNTGLLLCYGVLPLGFIILLYSKAINPSWRTWQLHACIATTASLIAKIAGFGFAREFLLDIDIAFMLFSGTTLFFMITTAILVGVVLVAWPIISWIEVFRLRRQQMGVFSTT